jgi:hypothetical protein
MPNNSDYRGPKLIGRSNYIEWQKEASIFLEIEGYMPYIDGSEANLLNYRFLYYNDANVARSLELAVKYIEREAEYKRNTKKALRAIKATLSNDNKDRFKDKNDITSVKYFDHRPPQRRQRRASDGPATPTTAATSLSMLWELCRRYSFFLY